MMLTTLYAFPFLPRRDSEWTDCFQKSSTKPTNGTGSEHRERLDCEGYVATLFRIKTSALNDWFSEVASVQRLARFSGSALRRIRFLSQTRTRPPTFCLRASGREPFTDVEKRTFVNALRQGFDFQGTSRTF